MVYLRKDCILREEYHTILNRICPYCDVVISFIENKKCYPRVFSNNLVGAAPTRLSSLAPCFICTLSSRVGTVI